MKDETKISKNHRDIIVMMESGNVLKCCGYPEVRLAYIDFIRNVRPKTIAQLVELDLICVDKLSTSTEQPTIMKLTAKGRCLARSKTEGKNFWSTA